jgi:hypothetical protein
MTEPDVRRSLLLLAWEGLSKGDAQLQEPIKVVAYSADRSSRVCFTSRPGELDMLHQLARLPAMQANALQAVQEAGRPVTSAEVARLAGYSFSTRVLAALRSLRQK